MADSPSPPSSYKFPLQISPPQILSLSETHFLKNIRGCEGSSNGKKRAAAVLSDDHTPATKKRVVLGELTNLSNIAKVKAGDNGPQQQLKPRATKAKCKAIKPSVKQPEVSLKKAQDPIVDFDTKSDDPQMCRAYTADIYQYLHKMEIEPKRRPLPNYIEKIQYDVTPNMRGILVDWLVEVAEEYKLLSDTFYLAVSYIDRFLSSNALTRQKLQLLGVSALLISSKYEEISHPHVEDFCYITDKTYSREDVIKMEADILKALNFEMGNPTIRTFLRRLDRFAQEGCKVSPSRSALIRLEVHKSSDVSQLEHLGSYLAELSLLDYNCLKFLPSLVAASVIFLARYILLPKSHPWSSTLEKYLGCRARDLEECVKIIHDLYLRRRANSLQAEGEVQATQVQMRCDLALFTGDPCPLL